MLANVRLNTGGSTEGQGVDVFSIGNIHHPATASVRLISSWSYGVTVSTLDSESSDRGSNPRRTLHGSLCHAVFVEQH
jgi:hypothetical protein